MVGAHGLQSLRCEGVMSLEKAIRHGKERRKPYRGAKAVDCSCRNNNGCPYCEANRMHKHKRRMVDE